MKLSTKLKECFTEIETRCAIVQTKLRKLGIEEPTAPKFDVDDLVFHRGDCFLKYSIDSSDRGDVLRLDGDCILDSVFAADDEKSLEELAEYLFPFQIKEQNLRKQQKIKSEKYKEQLLKDQEKYELKELKRLKDKYGV